MQKPSLYTTPLADRGAAQIALARAEAALGGARAFLYAHGREHLAIGYAAGAAPTDRQSHWAHLAATHAARNTCATVTRTASVLAGGTAIYAIRRCSATRAMRTPSPITLRLSPHTWEEAGRVSAGADATVRHLKTKKEERIFFVLPSRLSIYASYLHTSNLDVPALILQRDGAAFQRAVARIDRLRAIKHHDE